MTATAQANALFHRKAYGDALAARDKAGVAFHKSCYLFWASR